MPWPLLSVCFLLLVPVLQAQPSGAPGAPCLLPAEKLRLEREPKLDNRIKIYETASARCFDIVQRALAAPTPPSVSATLADWMQLLEQSLNDVEKTADRKKKSKALIRYEIQLRKSIAVVQDARMKVSYEGMEEIEAWTSKAGEIRRKFVDILFQR